MENLDLDIKNYSLSDVERFFKLKKTQYSVKEIELRETQLRAQLLNSGHIDKRFKRDLIHFLESAKKWLIDEKCKHIDNTPTTIPTEDKLDKINSPVYIPPTPKEENIINRPQTQYVYTQNSDFLPGNLNQLNTRVITKCLNIDTRFRSNFHNTNSSDITMQLPSKLNKVVSMELSALELPISFYGISKNYGNNFMHMYIKYSQPDCIPEIKQCHRLLTIPDGNYTESDLIDVINYMISKPDEPIIAETDLYIDLSGNIVNTLGETTDASGNKFCDCPPSTIYDVFSFVEFKLDINENGSGSRRVSVAPRENDIVDICEIILEFSKTDGGEPDNTSLYTKLGWNLGFTKPLYSGDVFYCAETIIEPATKYLYLAVDDFNNNSNSNFLSVFNQSIMSTDILARISLKGNRCNLLSENNYELTAEPRQYFGPVDIQRIRVRLLDEHGRVLQMKNSNYSFCLKLKMLYDL